MEHLTSTLSQGTRMARRHHLASDILWKRHQVRITTISTTHLDKKGTLQLRKRGGRPSMQPFMVRSIRISNGKCPVRDTPPLNGSRRCALGRITSHQAICWSCNMLMLSAYWFSAIINSLWNTCSLIAMTDPNLPNDPFPSYSVPTNIVLRGPGNAECSQRIKRWLPVERIGCEPCTNRHQYCAIGITDLRTPGTTVGPSWMALSAEEGTLVPQSPARSITVRSPLVLQQDGTLRYRDML